MVFGINQTPSKLEPIVPSHFLMKNFLLRAILPLAVSLPLCLPAQNDTITFSSQPILIDQTGSTPGFTITWSFQFPSIDSVARKFAQTYGIQNLKVNFEKRKDGYYVSTADYSNYNVLISRELFWSVTDGEWKPLSLTKGFPDHDPSNLYYDEYYYERIPYYGYGGWYRDVITYLEGGNPLSADHRLAIATAWYQRAMNLLSDEDNLADSTETFLLPKTKNALTPEQLDIYFSYMQKALGHYEILAAEYPDYETIVGPATVKLANMYMTVFMQMHYFQNEETALRILDRPPLVYPDFLLESARNLLESCPPKAVLFTYGDNDTYPLWYLQAKESVRRDVVVANLSLIYTGRYLNHLRTPIFDAKPLQFQLPETYYFNPATSYFFFTEAKHPTPFTDIFQCLLAAQDLGTRCGTPLLEFYTDQSGKHRPEGEAIGRYNNKVSLDFTTNRYLTRDKLAMLDLIYSNAPERPICFALTCSTILDPFKNHLVQEGLVYRFRPLYRVPTDADMKGTLDERVSRKLFLQKYPFKSKEPIGPEGLAYLNLYQVGMLKTAQAFQKKGKHKQAIQLLDKYFSAFPNERIPMDVSALFYAETYTKLDRTATSSRIINQVLDNFLAGETDTLDAEVYIRLMKRVALLNKDLALQGRLKLLWPE